MRNPAKLPWKDWTSTSCVESTGHFHRPRAERGKAGYDTHFRPARKRVVLSAPAKDAADLTCVLGVNDDKLTAEHEVRLQRQLHDELPGPVAKVLHETFGIEKGLMTTVHAYTNDQRLQDLPHDDLYRARAAAMNISPDHHRRGQGGGPGDSRLSRAS